MIFSPYACPPEAGCMHPSTRLIFQRTRRKERGLSLYNTQELSQEIIDIYAFISLEYTAKQ